jgi:hypothetical protein
MHTMRGRAVAVAVAGAVLVGGAIGATAFSASSSNAASATTTTPTAAGNAANGGTPNGAPAGRFKPNEGKGHEAGESKAREAQEDAGQVPTVP